jgi:hypothetical protein
VISIGADLLAPFSTGVSGFFRREFVSGPFAVGGCSALPGNLTLFALIHRRKAACSFGVFHNTYLLGLI